MKRARFIPAQVKTVQDDSPDACPHCGGGILNKRRTRRQARQSPLSKERRRPQLLLPELRRDIQALSARNRGIAPSEIRPDFPNRICCGYANESPLTRPPPPCYVCRRND